MNLFFMVDIARRPSSGPKSRSKQRVVKRTVRLTTDKQQELPFRCMLLAGKKKKNRTWFTTSLWSNLWCIVQNNIADGGTSLIKRLYHIINWEYEKISLNVGVDQFFPQQQIASVWKLHFTRFSLRSRNAAKVHLDLDHFFSLSVWQNAPSFTTPHK